MKRFLGFCTVAVACLGLGAGFASACELYDALEFDTDFGFQLAGKTFPPGHYAIERTDLQYGEPLRIVKAGMEVGLDFNTQDIEATEMPTSDHVVFSVVDGKHVLSEIWMNSKMVGCQVVDEAPKAKHEKKKVDAKRTNHSSKKDEG